MTTQKTTRPIGYQIIYCNVASIQSKQVISVSLKNAATLSVLDSNNNPVDYSLGYFLADVGDVFTLTAGTSVSGYTISFKVDGVIQTSPYTLTIGLSNITIAVNAYYDGFDRNFNTATWEDLKYAVLAEQSSVYSSYIGQTKTVTLTHSDNSTEVIELMLVDTTGTCYEYADGSGYAGLIFEQVNCLNSLAKMNLIRNNKDGYLGSTMATVILPEYIDSLPSEVKNVISQVKITRTRADNKNKLSTGIGYAFLPAEKEMYTTKSLSLSTEFNALTTFEYWQTAAQADKIKYRDNTKTNYYLSSMYFNDQTGYSSQFCYVDTTGRTGSGYVDVDHGVVPCIAI